MVTYDVNDAGTLGNGFRQGKFSMSIMGTEIATGKPGIYRCE